MRFKDEEKKTVNYCKSAIKNQEKLIGVNHIKLADSYYLLGNAYLTYARKVEALNSFKKAKEILYNNEAVES